MSLFCGPLLATGTDSAVNNALVRDHLVACNISGRQVRAHTVITDNLLIPRDDGTTGVPLLKVAGDLGSATPDDDGVLTLSGTGGNRSIATGSEVVMQDLQSPTEFLVGFGDAEYATIQDAVDAAGVGPAVVLVRAGTYAGFGLRESEVTVRGLATGVTGGVTHVTGSIILTAGTLEGLSCDGGITASGGVMFCVSTTALDVTDGEVTVRNALLLGPVTLTDNGTMNATFCLQFAGGITLTSGPGLAGGELNGAFSRFGAITQTGDNSVFTPNKVELDSCVLTGSMTLGTGATNVNETICIFCHFNEAVTQFGRTVPGLGVATALFENCTFDVSSGVNLFNLQGQLQVYNCTFINGSAIGTDRAVLTDDTNPTFSVAILNNAFVFSNLGAAPAGFVENNGVSAAVWIGGNTGIALDGSTPLGITGNAASGSVVSF